MVSSFENILFVLPGGRLSHSITIPKMIHFYVSFKTKSKHNLILKYKAKTMCTFFLHVIHAHTKFPIPSPIQTQNKTIYTIFVWGLCYLQIIFSIK